MIDIPVSGSSLYDECSSLFMLLIIDIPVHTHRSESPSTNCRELLLLTMNGKKSQENARNHAVSSPAACFNKQNLGNLFCLHIFRRHSPLGSRNRGNLDQPIVWADMHAPHHPTRIARLTRLLQM